MEEAENIQTHCENGIFCACEEQKCTAKRIRAYIRRDLGRIKRNLGYLEDYMSEGYAMPRKYISQYLTILELYRQQKYMFDNKTHVVENRIVSINQPFVRPMVRGIRSTERERILPSARSDT